MIEYFVNAVLIFGMTFFFCINIVAMIEHDKIKRDCREGKCDYYGNYEDNE